MKKITTVLTGVALACSAGFLFSSCTNSTSPSNPVVGAPSNVMALSKNATTISIKWTRDANDAGSDTVIVTNATTGLSSSVPTSSTATTADVNGSEGVVYNITVASTGGRSSSISWMTAQRSTGIKIYESADPSASDPSGLLFGSNITDAISLSGALNADFVLATITDGSVASGISLESGAVRNGNWNDDKVNGRGDYIVGGLNNDYRSTNYQRDMDTASQNAYDIPNTGDYRTTGSRVLIVKTQDSHLALVEIQPDQTTGNLYSTTASGYKYITVNVSYQSVVDQPYAARPHRQNYGLVPKSSAH